MKVDQFERMRRLHPKNHTAQHFVQGVSTSTVFLSRAPTTGTSDNHFSPDDAFHLSKSWKRCTFKNIYHYSFFQSLSVNVTEVKGNSKRVSLRHVRPSVRMHQRSPHRTNFREIWYRRLS